MHTVTIESPPGGGSPFAYIEQVASASIITALGYSHIHFGSYGGAIL